MASMLTVASGTRGDGTHAVTSRVEDLTSVLNTCTPRTHTHYICTHMCALSKSPLAVAFEGCEPSGRLRLAAVIRVGAAASEVHRWTRLDGPDALTEDRPPT